jgi:hypothetical protein
MKVSDYCKDWEPITFWLTPRESWDNGSMEGSIQLSESEFKKFYNKHYGNKKRMGRI